MAKKPCSYCDSYLHRLSECPHLPHGDAHREEKPGAYRRTSHKAPNVQNLPRVKKVVVCGIGITYNPNSPKNRIHKVQGAILLRLEQSIDAMHKRFTESEDTAGVGLADAAKRLITTAKEST